MFFHTARISFHPDEIFVDVTTRDINGKGFLLQNGGDMI